MAIGDTVFLKSGSLPLTVVKEDPNDGVTVSWFAGATSYSQMFPPDALVASDPQPAIDHARDKAKAQLSVDDPLPTKEVGVITP